MFWLYSAIFRQKFVSRHTSVRPG